MFRLIRADPPAEQVQLITFVPFLPDGRCVLIERPEGPGLPTGEVLDGEDYLIDTVLRVPLQTAGFRYQHVRPFGIDGGDLGEFNRSSQHLDLEVYVWDGQEDGQQLRREGGRCGHQVARRWPGENTGSGSGWRSPGE